MDRSDLRHAAVDKELDAGDVAAVIRGEEDDRLGDRIRRANAAQGRAGCGLRLELLDLGVAQAQLGLVAGRDDRARADDGR